MDTRPIGVFDSGVGGLTTVRELHKILPGENIIYFGDTARVPYGTRSHETICKYATQIIRFFSSREVKAIVSACGTISTNLSATEFSSAAGDIPYFTILQPSVDAAVTATRNKRIGVIATPASIRTGAFEARINALIPGAEVIGVPCPLLVPLVENGMTGLDNKITRLTLEMYLEPVLKLGADTLILGCTHYPLLTDIIADIMPGVTLLDSGACAAKATKAALEHDGKLCKGVGSTTYYVTDTVSNFVSVANNFMFEDIAEQVRHISIEAIDQY